MVLNVYLYYRLTQEMFELRKSGPYQSQRMDMLHFSIAENLLSCNIYKIPLEITAPDVMKNHQFGSGHFMGISKYRDCIKNTRKTDVSCLSILQHICLNRPITTFKTIRLKMNTIEKLLKKRPRLKILYLVRDPRAVYLSLQKVGWYKNYKVKDHCEILSKELNKSILLQQKYPQRMKRVYYELIAEQPLASLAEIYSFLGMKVHEEVKKHLISITHSHSSEKQYGTKRANASYAAHKWEGIIPKDLAIQIDNACNYSLKQLGYKQFSNRRNVSPST